MNTVLFQECTRYNKLLTVMRESLTNLIKAIKGTIVMNAQLEGVYNAMASSEIPPLWKKVSHPSLMSLSSYMADLYERLAMYTHWYDHGTPTVFWMSGFFFTQAFMTAAMQNFARKNKIAIDLVSFDHEVMKEDPKKYAEITQGPEDGVYTRGLFMEGAQWSAEAHCLIDSDPKTLYTTSPMIWLRPMLTAEIPKRQVYLCPIYKTADRRGVLSTTGHSSNFVMDIKMPVDCDPGKWLRRGTALLTQLMT